MQKFSMISRLATSAMLSLPLFSCGASNEQSSGVFAESRVPCGEDNGIPKKCGTDRSVEFEVRFDDLMRYTECGKNSAEVYPFFDKNNPFVASTCAGTPGKFVSHGPLVTAVETGWVNAKVHIWPCAVSDMSRPEDTFALDIYSASAGGILKRDVYDYRHYNKNPRPDSAGFSTIKDFDGRPSSLATKMEMKGGPWVEVPISAPIAISAPISDLEVRVQILSPSTCVMVLGKDIIVSRHPE